MNRKRNREENMLFAVLLLLSSSAIMCMQQMDDEKPKRDRYAIETQYCPISPLGASCMQGDRDYMEDDWHTVINPKFQFYGVYDGHGGSGAAQLAADHLHTFIDISQCNDTESVHKQLENAFERTDYKIKIERLHEQGATGAVGFIINGILYFANAGDSRGVLCSNGKALPLSCDHTPDNKAEADRIRECIKQHNSTAFVLYNGSWYIKRSMRWRHADRYLRPTRALGDIDCRPHVICTPEIKHKKLEQEDAFMIIATDGFWDAFTNQEAVDFVKEDLSKKDLKPEDFGKAAQLLRNAAYIKGSKDNISVIIAGLKDLHKQ
jgi:serine/threonine protein phosphatase PrpC